MNKSRTRAPPATATKKDPKWQKVQLCVCDPTSNEGSYEGGHEEEGHEEGEVKDLEENDPGWPGGCRATLL